MMGVQPSSWLKTSRCVLKTILLASAPTRKTTSNPASGPPAIGQRKIGPMRSASRAMRVGISPDIISIDPSCVSGASLNGLLMEIYPTSHSVIQTTRVVEDATPRFLPCLGGMYARVAVACYQGSRWGRRHTSRTLDAPGTVAYNRSDG